MGSPELSSSNPSRKDAIRNFMADRKREVDWSETPKEEQKEKMEALTDDLSDEFRKLREGKGNTNSQGDVRH